MKFDLRITAAVAGALLASGCNAPDSDAGGDAISKSSAVMATSDTAICVDEHGDRVHDEKCPNNQAHGSVHPYYIAHGGVVPYYGSPAQGGSATPESGHVYSAAPASTAVTESEASGSVSHATGMTETSEGVSHGGFGGTAESFGAAHGGGGGE